MKVVSSLLTSLISLFKPVVHQERLSDDKISATYSFLREQLFLGTFVGYASYYLLRKNISFASIKYTEDGYSKAELGFALAAISISYGLSKFFMGNVSDRSNAKLFITAGLLLSAIVNLIIGYFSFATSSLTMLCILLFFNGWFQGMGWPACGRTMVHWFSVNERGTRMSIWNTSHNVGGGLIGILIPFGLVYFGTMKMGVFYFPALISIGLAVLIFFLMRDTPQSCGLPSIEEYRNDYPKDYDINTSEKEMTSREIFVEHILYNKYLWYIAVANIFVYVVRYGIGNWIPTYLEESRNYNITESGYAFFFYEYAGIPGTLLCGWMSDRLFKGRRAPACVLFMVFVTIFVLAYWLNPYSEPWVGNIILIFLGFLIYGPVMLIGLHALDMVQKKAAGTAAGLTGLLAYLGGALIAEIGLGVVSHYFGWNACFIILVASCFLAIFFVSLTWNSEVK